MMKGVRSPGRRPTGNHEGPHPGLEHRPQAKPEPLGRVVLYGGHRTMMCRKIPQ